MILIKVASIQTMIRVGWCKTDNQGYDVASIDKIISIYVKVVYVGGLQTSTPYSDTGHQSSREKKVGFKGTICSPKRLGSPVDSLPVEKLQHITRERFRVRNGNNEIYFGWNLKNTICIVHQQIWYIELILNRQFGCLFCRY